MGEAGVVGTVMRTFGTVCLHSFMSVPSIVYEGANVAPEKSVGIGDRIGRGIGCAGVSVVACDLLSVVVSRGACRVTFYGVGFYVASVLGPCHRGWNDFHSFSLTEVHGGSVGTVLACVQSTCDPLVGR